ncbi:MAG TPA: long-chain fatty acid--CoA ligase [Bacteroidales bacterium]|nr:long-chain fatty acid--CoA ligase [Bacteroidales bacterium]
MMLNQPHSKLTQSPERQKNRVYPENVAFLYKEAAEKFGALPAFATRESALNWKPVSYRELYEQGLNLATGLIELGVQARDHVGLFGDNRFEWILSDCAVQICGAADVPRGRDITDQELYYIIDHAGIKVTFVETEELQSRVMKMKHRLAKLQTVILLDPKGRTVEGTIHLSEIIDMGAKLRLQGDKRAEARMSDIKPDDLFTLIYTSGTTGKPKGVMLTHANMMSQVRNLPGKYDMTDRVISVLPIWHIFERVVEMFTISFGGCTYYSGINTLGDDMRNVEPTFMASAPRLWEKLHERIIKNIKAAHPMRQILFHTAYFLAKQYFISKQFITNQNLKLSHEPLWKRLILLPFHVVRWVLVLPWYGFFNAAVLERVRLGAGGSLKETISGGGALPLHIDRFFNYVGIPVLEGYGMTETCPVISFRTADNMVIGTVGPPIAETEVKIVDPETEEVLYPNAGKSYDGKAVRGEIWVKGPQVMKGYYKDSELTNRTIVDGWLRTGDLGMVTHNNSLKILGRSKSTIVLSSGENVEPEPLELRLKESIFIEQCMVVGQDKKFLGALIVPALNEFKQAGFEVQTIDSLATNPDAMRIIKEDIRRMISSNNGFKAYEQIRDFRILPIPFQVGEELTNLFKVKRHVVEKKFNQFIDEIYSKG